MIDGVPFADATPDETAFVKFHKRLREAKLDEYLFQSVVKHLDSHGFLVQHGTMVDATIIEQSTGSKNDDGENTRDQDASFTRKARQSPSRNTRSCTPTARTRRKIDAARCAAAA